MPVQEAVSLSCKTCGHSVLVDLPTLTISGVAPWSDSLPMAAKTVSRTGRGGGKRRRRKMIAWRRRRRRSKGEGGEGEGRGEEKKNKENEHENKEKKD